MTRKELLEKASERVMTKVNDYGQPEDTFGLIADLWSDYLGEGLSPKDVCMMMILLKIARGTNEGITEDTLVDIAGYAACAAEVCTY